MKLIVQSKSYDTGPIWSPDGSRIYFIRGSQKIISVLPNGEDEQEIYSAESLKSVVTLTWATGSERLAFAELGPGGGLVSINKDGSVRKLIFASDDLFGASCSPTHQLCIIEKYEQGRLYPGTTSVAIGGTSDLYAIDYSGNVLARLTDNNAREMNVTWITEGN